LATWCDVTNEAEVVRVAGEVREHFGRIDTLVCCAGGDIGAGGTSAGRSGRPD